jgi:predicted negative regulator of RcsB-dependent stress response
VAIYDTEEEQVEALQKWWQANSQAVIVGVAAGLCLMFAGNFWKSYQQDKRMQASAMYSQLLDADTKNQPDQIEKLGKQIGVQYGSTAYAQYSALFEAKAKVEQGDLPAAKTILQKVIADADDDIKNVARIRLVNLMLATGEYEAGLKLISETNAASTTGFTSNYEELKGDLYVALDRLDEARTAYENALRDGAQSPLLQFKLDDLTAPSGPPQPMAKTDAPAVPAPATAPVVAPATDVTK